MKVVATVESRMGSSRLPGKNARPILGQPMLGRLFERLKRCDRIDTVCLATTQEPADDPLEAIAVREGVHTFRGSTDDVLGRVLGAAQSVGADVLVEILGDCPLVDPKIVDSALRRYEEGGYDYVANILDVLTFPVGFDVQVYAVALLEDVSALTQDPGDRVNVTPFIYHHPERYRLLNLKAPPELDRPRYRLCVDYAEDFALVSTIFDTLYPHDPAFDARAIVGLLDRRPDLAHMNTRPGPPLVPPSSNGAAAQEVAAC